MGLAAGAGGNPLYLTELLDALVRAGTLFVDDDRIEVNELTAPDSLAAAIADRLEFLSTPVCRLLSATAMLGCDFAVADPKRVTGRRVNELLPLLDEAILAGVLLDDGPELSFWYPPLRAAPYEGMPPAVRAAWHLDAAPALIGIDALADRVARPRPARHRGPGPADAAPTAASVAGDRQATGWALGIQTIVASMLFMVPRRRQAGSPASPRGSPIWGWPCDSGATSRHSRMSR
jgi:hypothetical protein